jgi:integrase
MLKENNTRTGFFEHHEFKALRKALPDYLQGFVTFGYKFGWRISEIRGLKWNQVDMQQGIVRLEVGETKNKEARTVYLDTELKAVISNQFISRRLDSKYVFHREGARIGDIRFSWKKACKQTGQGDRLFHDLRRTAARNMIRSGVPEIVAMQVTGHKTRSVFDRYNIVSSEDLKEAAKKQEAYLEGLS